MIIGSEENFVEASVLTVMMVCALHHDLANFIKNVRIILFNLSVRASSLLRNLLEGLPLSSILSDMNGHFYFGKPS